MSRSDEARDEMLVYAANLLAGFCWADEGDSIPEGEPVADDGRPVDSIGEDGSRWRVLRVDGADGKPIITKHRIRD